MIERRIPKPPDIFHQPYIYIYIYVTGTEILNSSLVYYKVITRCFIAEINIVQYINICDGL